MSRCATQLVTSPQTILVAEEMGEKHAPELHMRVAKYENMVYVGEAILGRAQRQ